MFIPKKKLGKIHRKNKQLNNGFQNHYSLSNENQSKYHNSHFIFNNYTQFRNYGNMLLTYKKNSDLTNECKLLKSNILELNETIKKKDLIISNLKKRINSMSSNSESNRSKSQSENYDNEKNNEGDKINDFNDGNTLTEIRKNINPLKGYFQNSNKFSLTFRNSSIKSKISEQNSYVKNIPFTLTYFRYKEKISKKKKDLKTNLYNEFKKDDSNSKKKDIKKNSKNTSLSPQKKTKNLLQDINNKTKKFSKKEKKEKKKNSPINKNLLSHRNLKSCTLNTKITKEKEEKKKVSKNKNKNKTNIKKRNMKIGISYKELQQMKISHYKKNIPKKEIKENEKNINDYKDNKKMKKSFNNNNKEEKNTHSLNLRKNSVNGNENKIKFVDIDDNNSNNDVEKIFENIEEQNLKDLKNKLKSGIKSFSNSKDNKNEKNKNEDFHKIDYNKNINNLKTNEIEYKRLNEREIKNKGLITIKNKFSLGYNKKFDSSSSSSNSFKLFDKQNDDYLNKIGFLDKEDNFQEFFFERSIIDDDSYSYSKEK